MKATILIAVGIVWHLGLVAIAWWLLHSTNAMVGFGVDMPSGTPQWLTNFLFLLSLGLVLLGWVVPLAVGIRMRVRED